MLKSLIFGSIVAAILLLALIAQRKTQQRRIRVPLNPRGRLTSDDTQ